MPTRRVLMSNRRATVLRLILASCVACLFPLGAAVGQSGGGTPGGGGSISDLEQQVLQGMSPEQRDAIMGQLGITPGNGQNANGRRNDENQQNEMGQRSNQHEPTPSEQAEIDRLSPYLQG